MKIRGLAASTCYLILITIVSLLQVTFILFSSYTVDGIVRLLNLQAWPPSIYLFMFAIVSIEDVSRVFVSNIWFINGVRTTYYLLISCVIFSGGEALNLLHALLLTYNHNISEILAIIVVVFLTKSVAHYLISRNLIYSWRNKLKWIAAYSVLLHVAFDIIFLLINRHFGMDRELVVIAITLHIMYIFLLFGISILIARAVNAKGTT